MYKNSAHIYVPWPITLDCANPCMYMYVCVCIYIYIYIYICIYKHAYMLARVKSFVVYECSYKYLFVGLYVCVFLCV
jgi:hypothetical protein